jgi:hypothetical protein
LTPGIVSPVDWSRTTPVIVPPEFWAFAPTGQNRNNKKIRLINWFFILMVDFVYGAKVSQDCYSSVKIRLRLGDTNVTGL